MLPLADLVHLPISTADDRIHGAAIAGIGTGALLLSRQGASALIAVVGTKAIVSARLWRAIAISPLHNSLDRRRTRL